MSKLQLEFVSVWSLSDWRSRMKAVHFVTFWLRTALYKLVYIFVPYTSKLQYQWQCICCSQQVMSEDITRNVAFHCSAGFHGSAKYMAILCELLRALIVSWESSRDFPAQSWITSWVKWGDYLGATGENLKSLSAFTVFTGNIFLPFSSLVYTTGRGHPARLCMMSTAAVDTQSHSLGGYCLRLVSFPSSHPLPSPPPPSPPPPSPPPPLPPTLLPLPSLPQNKDI